MATKPYTGETASPARPKTLTEDTSAGIMCRESRVTLRSFAVVDVGDAVHRWLMHSSITALRISMGVMILGSLGICVAMNDG